MNRQIKFRVWDNRGKYFRRANIEGPKNSAWGVKIDRGIFSLESTEGLIYQQWTGLFDANNKEIYEGDIVRLDYKRKPYLGRRFDESGKDIGPEYAQEFEDFYRLYSVEWFSGTYGISGQEYAALINGFVVKEISDTISGREAFPYCRKGKIGLFGLPFEFEGCGTFGTVANKCGIVGNIFENSEFLTNEP